MTEKEEIDGWEIEPYGIANRKDNNDVTAEIFRFGRDNDLRVEFPYGSVCIHIPLAVINRLIEIDREKS